MIMGMDNGAAAGLGLSVVTVVGTLISAYFHVVIRGLEKDNLANEKAIGDLKTDMEKRVGALHDDHAAKIHALESERAQYISRAEHATFQNEMRASVDGVKAAVQESTAAIMAAIGKIADRVVHLEAEAGRN